tara:strand:- start:620 stop:1177 length:558 start_codon:yes stop_codon:yes gene_type:complete
MSLTKTPICDFGKKAETFKLLSTDNTNINLEDVKGENGTLIMFICNHCPYVKAVIQNIVDDTNDLKKIGVNSVAIMSNDTDNYPDDSFDKMKIFSDENKFNFPYLFDESQEIAKKFGAVCTPDFFGYNKNLELQYRGRIRELKDLKPVQEGHSDLLNAMTLIAKTGKGPSEQIPSMGCNIKWFKN